MTRFWHPFANMRSVIEHGELMIDRADGYHVFDEAGNRYLDATASLWYCNVGHGRKEIVEAARDQMERLEAYSTFGDLTNRSVSELVELLGRYAPVTNSVSFLTSGGSDSIDTAVKLARRYHQIMGAPQRRYVISRERAYHGMHVAGTSLAGIEANAEGYGELIHDAKRVAWDSFDDLAGLINEIGAENIAAFICEPVIGAGGVFAPPSGYLEKARALCRDAGILFVADEVVTGFGRTGYWFASERWHLEPDMIVCAKGITSGYLPLGAVIASPWIAEPWFEGDAGMWRHGYTYSGHATVAAAAVANLEIIEQEDLLTSGRRLEEGLATSLADLSQHSLVSEIRAGTGALAAVQLDPVAVERDDQLPAKVISACRDHGIMTRMLLGHAIHVSPPLTLDDAGLDELASGLRKALDQVLV